MYPFPFDCVITALRHAGPRQMSSETANSVVPGQGICRHPPRHPLANPEALPAGQRAAVRRLSFAASEADGTELGRKPDEVAADFSTHHSDDSDRQRKQDRQGRRGIASVAG